MTVWKKHMGQLAWPTLGLSLLLLVSGLVTWIGVLKGFLPLGLGGLIMFVVDYFWFTPLHEAAHGNIGGQPSRKRLDQAIGWLAAAFFVAPFSAFRALHLRHHGHVNRKGEDPDLWVAGSTPLVTVLRCLSIVPYYYGMLFGSMRRESAVKRRLAWQTGGALLLILALVIFLARRGFGPILLGLWIIPGWLAIAVLAFVFDYLPHRPHEDEGRWTNSRIIVGGRWLTFLTTGQNYHLIHHLFPRVPFYRYGTVFQEMRPELEEHEVLIQEV